MIKVTVEIEANDWEGVRLAMRQAYARDLERPLTPGKHGRIPYRLTVVATEEDTQEMALNSEGMIVWPNL